MFDRSPGNALVIWIRYHHRWSAFTQGQFEERVDENLHEPEDKIAESLMTSFEHGSEASDYCDVWHVASAPGDKYTNKLEAIARVTLNVRDCFYRPGE